MEESNLDLEVSNTPNNKKVIIVVVIIVILLALIGGVVGFIIYLTSPKKKDDAKSNKKDDAKGSKKDDAKGSNGKSNTITYKDFKGVCSIPKDSGTGSETEPLMNNKSNWSSEKKGMGQNITPQQCKDLCNKDKYCVSYSIEPCNSDSCKDITNANWCDLFKYNKIKKNNGFENKNEDKFTSYAWVNPKTKGYTDENNTKAFITIDNKEYGFGVNLDNPNKTCYIKSKYIK